MSQPNVVERQEPVVAPIIVKNPTSAYHYYGMGHGIRGFDLAPGESKEISTWNDQVQQRIIKYVEDGILEATGLSINLSSVESFAVGAAEFEDGTTNAVYDDVAGTVTVTLASHTMAVGDSILSNDSADGGGDGSLSFPTGQVGEVIAVDGDTFTVAAVIAVGVDTAGTFDLDWAKVKVLKATDSGKIIEVDATNAVANVIAPETLPENFKTSVTAIGNATNDVVITGADSDLLVDAAIIDSKTAAATPVAIGGAATDEFKVAHVYKRAAADSFVVHGDTA
jgi:hypothetical protein